MADTNLDSLQLATPLAGSNIAAGAITSAKMEEGLLRYADRQLTNAELKACRATPITLVAAPGANKAILVERVHLVSSAAAAAWTESADNLAVEYADGTDILTIETTGLLDQASVQLRTEVPAVALATPIANSAVQLFNNGDGEFGGGNAANTFSVRVWYRVVPTVAFGA